MFRLSIIAVITLAAVTACQPLPRPFEDQQLPPDAPILVIPDVYGVVVEPTVNAPKQTVTILQKAMAEALQNSDVPATTGPSNAHSYHLESEITEAVPAGATEAITVRWLLKDAEGKVIGTDTQHGEADAKAWIKGGKQAGQFIPPEAAKIAGLLQPPEPVEQKPERRIYVARVKNAPGDGAISLSRSLGYLISRAGLEVIEQDKPGTIKIQGEVEMAPAPQNQLDVKIVWHVLAPNGHEIGQVSQENTVAKGSLDGAWSEVAMAVTGAARDDLLGIVARLPSDTGGH